MCGGVVEYVGGALYNVCELYHVKKVVGTLYNVWELYIMCGNSIIGRIYVLKSYIHDFSVKCTVARHPLTPRVGLGFWWPQTRNF